MLLRRVVWMTIGAIGIYLAAGVIWSSGLLFRVKEPDRQRFQQLLTSQGGWHDIHWNTLSPGVVAGVEAKHEVAGITYSFRVDRVKDMGTSVTISLPSCPTVWERESKSNKRGFAKGAPEEARAMKQTLERLADEIWDAFMQGENE